MNPRILFSHPTGNANVRAALAGLSAAGMLAEFHTAIAAFPGGAWGWLGKGFQRRSFDPSLRPFTVQHPWRELTRMIASKLKLNSLVNHETGVFCIDAIYQAQDKAAARRLKKFPKKFSAVYAYEDGARESFAAAKELGLRRIYDLPIAYWQTLRQLLAEEAERLPAWKVTLGGGVSDSEKKLQRKTEELELADMVVCPSQFVARSLPETARDKKIIVTPFGSPPNAPEKKDFSSTSKKLRVLFAGSMSQRKGLGDLFAAMKQLNHNDVELVVMGAPQAPLEFYRSQFAGFTHEPPRPHADVLKLMQTCDVFCLPSIVEGRALVMQEAMSQGLPLIVTANTGGEDLIEEGRTGFLVPIRSAEKIAEKIAWFADHRAALPEMSRAAQAKAAALTWENYGRTIASEVSKFNHS
jgi:glycosyltransferase involved in cell wall biosynthesis